MNASAPPVPPHYVLWLDPGETTGWALWHCVEGVLHADEYTFNEIGVKLERWLSTAGPRTVVGCEKFIITQETSKKSQQPAALHVTGIAKSLALQYQAWEFLNDQTSASAKSFCPNSMLKSIGWYSTTRGHANDACRHLFLYLTRTHRVPTKLLMKAYEDLDSIT